MSAAHTQFDGKNCKKNNNKIKFVYFYLCQELLEKNNKCVYLS